jgi:hypothetical protein
VQCSSQWSPQPWPIPEEMSQTLRTNKKRGNLEYEHDTNIIKPTYTLIDCEKYTFCVKKIIGAPKKFKKWHRPLFRPRTNHTCHQKPNRSRETVPSTPQSVPSFNLRWRRGHSRWQKTAVANVYLPFILTGYRYLIDPLFILRSTLHLSVTREKVFF